VSGQFRSGFVCVLGRPNVGKSTLVNRLVGHKIAIMSDKPQTTRNKIKAVLTREDAQVVFIDTPGVHKPRHRLGEYMVEAAVRTLKEVDLILYILDAGAEVAAGEEYILALLSEVQTPVFLVVNKADLVKKDRLLAIIDDMSRRRHFAEVVPVSAITGDNLDRLVSLVIGYLPPGPQYYPADALTDQPERFVMAELIREKVLHLTREEVPHGVAVEVAQVEERSSGLLYVGANIYVERESQKGILIGKGGQLLKEIGQRARVDMEHLLGSRIFLELWVKVRKDWRQKEGDLRFFGYNRKDL